MQRDYPGHMDAPPLLTAWIVALAKATPEHPATPKALSPKTGGNALS
jgi:hypothetical protein